MGKKKDKKMSKRDKANFMVSLTSGIPIGKAGKSAHDLLDRYGVEKGARYKSDSGQEDRTAEMVQKDLQEAMMNDYDTRRALEAGAMAGNKDAKRFAKKGISTSAQDFLDSYQVLKDLKKEYVGGGGMRGPENEAGLTYALVKADRENMISGFDDKYATKTALEEMQDKIKEEAVGEPPEPEPSKELTIADEGVSDYEAGLGGFGTDIFGGDDLTQATDEATSMTGGSSDAAEDYLNEYKANVAGGLKLSGVSTRGPKSGIRPGEGF